MAATKYAGNRANKPPERAVQQHNEVIFEESAQCHEDRRMPPLVEGSGVRV